LESRMASKSKSTPVLVCAMIFLATAGQSRNR
jgi:hypothetical protein